MKRIGIAVLGAWLGGCAAQEASPPAASSPAPRSEEFRFRCAGPLDIRFLHLEAGGKFQFYDRARFTTTRGLGGTWRRTGPDTLALRCERWSRQVLSGSLRVRFGSAWEKQRATVRAALVAYLRGHPGQAAFPQAELEDVGCWEEERELPGGREFVTVIPISASPEGATRSDLEHLIRALDDYERGGDPREIHARVHAHRGVEFIEWIDWTGYADPVDPAEVASAIDRLEPGEQLADVWTGLGAREFDTELWWGDRFRFFKAPKPVR